MADTFEVGSVSAHPVNKRLMQAVCETPLRRSVLGNEKLLFERLDDDLESTCTESSQVSSTNTRGSVKKRVQFSEKPEIYYVSMDCDTDLMLLPTKCGRRSRSQDDRSRRHIKKMAQNHENIVASVMEASQQLKDCLRGVEKMMTG